MIVLMKSKKGEVNTEEYWRDYTNEFWAWAEKQNRYVHHTGAKTNRKSFTKPADAFERVVRILGLEVVSDDEPGYSGVF